MEKAPFSWIRNVAAEFSDLDAIPLFGNAPAFDWSHLASLLSSCFQGEVSLRPSHQEWKKPSEIKKGLGINPFLTAIHVIPLNSSLLWAMPHADMDKFTSRMLYEKAKGKTSEIIREGFYQYLLLEALSSIQQIEPLQKLTFQLEEEPLLSDEICFCIDLEIQIDDKTCWGTLLIPSSFRKKWIEHFSQTALEYFPTETAKQTELILGLKTGASLLSQEEWKAFQPGDFLLLDRTSYDIHKQTGIATLHLNETPLFQVKITHNKVELLGIVLSYEEIMEQKKIEAEGEEAVSAIKDTPLNITVELARFRMSLDRLMHLAPGNLLELPVHPDQSVSLCINGKKIGSGELVHLGEALGVRILELG